MGKDKVRQKNCWLTLEQKNLIKKKSEDNPKGLTQWANKTFNVSLDRSTVSKMIKKKYNEEKNNSQVKRKSVVKFPVLESALLEWFRQVESSLLLTNEI